MIAGQTTWGCITMKRREFLAAMGAGAAAGCIRQSAYRTRGTRPNILFAIADDQAWPHTGAMGDPVVQTPTFDRLAREGGLFTHAFCSSPSCTPSRGAVLTGQDFWRLEQGASLWSSLPARFAVYPELLAGAGYHVGHTRKGWGPGRLEESGRRVNPAGQRYKNFAEFLAAKPGDAPFCFWFGSTDPHRPYAKGSGIESGKDPAAVQVPPFLPDAPGVRSDILDYFVEVERYDREVGELIQLLEERGELDNTLVVMTSDNGMPFPRAKANLYDYGVRMPLAIRWGAEMPGGRVVDDFVSFTDFAPTFLDVAGVKAPGDMTGRSLLNVLVSRREGLVDFRRDRAHFGRERHTNLREGGVSYPARGIRSVDYLYIRNFEPDRWPAGDPPVYGDIDGSSPTKTYLVEHAEDDGVAELFRLATAKRPAEELYRVKDDPGQMR
ncbi:MAG: sulfatase, partial [Candidatus Hydrogenedentes bacterium]|nr:sulfatase [Candidatus Hydrogenedentota bacterium]